MSNYFELSAIFLSNEQRITLKTLTGDFTPEDLVAFWELASVTDWGKCLTNRADWCRSIPVKIHGDDASAYKEQPVLFVSVLGFAHQEDRMLCIAVPTKRHHVECKVNHTLQAIGLHLGESFTHLEVGGWKIIYIASTGDLKFHYELIV